MGVLGGTGWGASKIPGMHRASNQRQSSRSASQLVPPPNWTAGKGALGFFVVSLSSRPRPTFLRPQSCQLRAYRRDNLSVSTCLGEFSTSLCVRAFQCLLEELTGDKLPDDRPIYIPLAMASKGHGSSLGSELLASRVPASTAASKPTANGAVVDAGLRSQQHCTFVLAVAEMPEVWRNPGMDRPARFAYIIGSGTSGSRDIHQCRSRGPLSYLPTRPRWAEALNGPCRDAPFQTHGC